MGVRNLGREDVLKASDVRRLNVVWTKACLRVLLMTSRPEGLSGEAWVFLAYHSLDQRVERVGMTGVHLKLLYYRTAMAALSGYHRQLVRKALTTKLASHCVIRKMWCPLPLIEMSKNEMRIDIT